MKTKTLLCIALIALAISMNAQDKYDFVSIAYDCYKITISQDDGNFTTEEVDLNRKERDPSNIAPLLKRVKYFQDQGWELFSYYASAAGGGGTGSLYVSYAIMRKKIEAKKTQ